MKDKQEWEKEFDEANMHRFGGMISISEVKDFIHQTLSNELSEYKKELKKKVEEEFDKEFGTREWVKEQPRVLKDFFTTLLKE